MCAAELTAFELLPRVGLDFVLRHVDGARDPFAEAHPWYALLEISSQHPDEAANTTAENMLTTAAEEGALADGVLAASLTQAADFWRLREMMSEAQLNEGGSIKNDVSVPVADLPEFIRRGMEAVEAVVPGCRPVPFGHYGDGNIHFNISQPEGMDKAAFLARWDDVAGAVNRLVLEYGGSISAEHGIGYMKHDILPTVKSDVEMDMMRRIKAALDPQGILNPGKVI
jgi:FAD/FMN-containing dehydrogenase